MLIIDIETKGREDLLWYYQQLTFEKDPEKAKEDLTDSDWLGMMAVDHEFCRIVCIGIKQIKGETRILDSIEQLNTEEWNRWLTQMPIITFNGKNFDIPILIKHGKKLGLNLPYERLTNACKRFGYGDRHVDLMESLAMGGRPKSLDTYLQIYLGVKKNTCGKDFFRTATDEEIKQHCKEDLDLEEQLYIYFYGYRENKSSSLAGGAQPTNPYRKPSKRDTDSPEPALL